MTEQLYTRRAVLGPSTYDEATRTCEAVVVTGAAVSRNGERPDGSYGRWHETLDLAGAELGQLRGAPVLLDHQHNRAEARVGVVTDVRREADAIVATLRFSQRPDVDALLADIRDGIARNVSLGYLVQEWR